MMKSFQESNGTVLSTNWKEVGAKKIECTPPEVRLRLKLRRGWASHEAGGLQMRVGSHRALPFMGWFGKSMWHLSTCYLLSTATLCQSGNSNCVQAGLGSVPQAAADQLQAPHTGGCEPPTRNNGVGVQGHAHKACSTRSRRHLSLLTRWGVDKP